MHAPAWTPAPVNCKHSPCISQTLYRIITCACRRCCQHGRCLAVAIVKHDKLFMISQVYCCHTIYLTLTAHCHGNEGITRSTESHDVHFRIKISRVLFVCPVCLFFKTMTATPALQSNNNNSNKQQQQQQQQQQHLLPSHSNNKNVRS